MAVTNKEELYALVARVKKAQTLFATYTQEQVDAVFRSAALAATVSLGGTSAAQAEEDKVLYIYNWADYLSKGVL